MVVEFFGGAGGDAEGDADSCCEEQRGVSKAHAISVDDSLSQSPV